MRSGDINVGSGLGRLMGDRAYLRSASYSRSGTQRGARYIQVAQEDVYHQILDTLIEPSPSAVCKG